MRSKRLFSGRTCAKQREHKAPTVSERHGTWSRKDKHQEKEAHTTSKLEKKIKSAKKALHMLILHVLRPTPQNENIDFFSKSQFALFWHVCVLHYGGCEAPLRDAGMEHGARSSEQVGCGRVQKNRASEHTETDRSAALLLCMFASDPQYTSVKRLGGAIAVNVRRPDPSESSSRGRRLSRLHFWWRVTKNNCVLH